jgi:hypothetical protein
MRRVHAYIFTIGWLLASVAYALPGITTLTLPEVHDNLDFSGYADGSYNYLLRSNKFISGNYDRANDVQQNGLTLQQLTLKLQKLPQQGWGGMVDTILGRDANEVVPNGMNANVFSNPVIGLIIAQAYLQYAKNNYWLLLGEMQSISGIEQYDYTGDINFSRSILYEYAQPGIHVGFRGIKKISEQLSLIVGLNNGWNTIRHASQLNTGEIGINYELHPKFSMLFNLYSGQQYMTDFVENGPMSQRRLVDIFGTWTITDKWSLAANYDYAVQLKAALPGGTLGRAAWQGLAAYINYNFKDKWYTSVRGEVFSDIDGYRTGVKQNWRELTLTVAYQWLKQLKIYAETRHDFSNVSAFQNKTGTAISNNQQSYALNALYEFG